MKKDKTKLPKENSAIKSYKNLSSQKELKSQKPLQKSSQKKSAKKSSKKKKKTKRAFFDENSKNIKKLS